nr:DUF4194 domain-containing protein [Oceanococcus sp. HetDA_MAG_MS8]
MSGDDLTTPVTVDAVPPEQNRGTTDVEAAGVSLGDSAEITLLRKAQQWLLGHGVVYHSKHPELYRALTGSQASVRTLLNELGLSMTVEETVGVVMLRLPTPDDDEDEDAHPLVRRSTLSLTDSLTAVVLRDYYRERQAQQDITIQVDLETLQQRLQPFMAIYDSSEALFNKKVGAAVDRFNKWHILNKVRGQDDVYEITPVIAIVVDARWLTGLVSEFRELAEKKAGANAVNEEAADG